MANSKNMFPDLHADICSEVTELESLCLNCGENGTTKLMLTKIPFYKEVVLMSFSCDHCNWRNNELQPAATIQEKGILYKLRVCSTKDLTRQVVKTKHASISIPELNFEIPSGTQEGTVTTIEGVLQRAYDGIKSRQQDLKTKDKISSDKLEEFLQYFVKLQECKVPFHFILRDCSGNSFLENIYAPKTDAAMEVTHFSRSKDEALLMGIMAQEDEEDPGVEDQSDLKNEVLEFLTNCSNCKAPCVTNMKLTNIPLFKDIIIMATVCQACGHRTNEVKSGGGIGTHGIKYTLKIMSEKDLKRDLVKSDTCQVCIPELELEIGSTALIGCYTTVEGLITHIKKQLVEDNPLVTGDSAPPALKKKMKLFLERLNQILDLSFPCTLILDDPCGNSYLQDFDGPSNVIFDKYMRTSEQNEELGLNDMKVENYEQA